MFDNNCSSVAFDIFAPLRTRTTSGQEKGLGDKSALLAHGFLDEVNGSFINNRRQTIRRPYLTEVKGYVESNHKEENLAFNICLLPKDFSKHRPENKPLQRSESSRESTSKASQDNMTSPQYTHIEFEGLKNDLNQRLRLKLMRSRYFSLNELYKQTEQKEAFDKEFEGTEKLVAALPDLTKLSPQQFVDLCSSDKYLSKAVQTALIQTTTVQSKTIIRLCECSVDSLMSNKYGNYILQDAVRLSSKMAATVERISLANFQSLMLNEYASRVMQVLARVSFYFRDYVLRWFLSGLEDSVEQLSAVFLFTSAIESVDCSEHLRLAMQAIFGTNFKRLASSKYFKRIVMSFVEKCGMEDLDNVFTYFNFRKKFLSLLDDKFGALLINSMIRREHKETIDILLHKLRFFLPSLYETKFFKFFLFRLVKYENGATVKEAMFEALTTMSDQSFQQSTSARESLYFYVHLLISLMPQDRTDLLVRMAAQLEDKDGLLDLLRTIRNIPAK